MTRNGAIGDAGVAALSAAIRTVSSSKKNKNETDITTVFDCLDLSGCGISDTGAEALAIALDRNDLCIRHLDLSNNQISDEGAGVLGRALADSKIETLDLSNNKDIGDSGAKALAEAFQKGAITNLFLRSCNVHADGAADFAKSLQSIGRRQGTGRPAYLKVDLSGNPLGILRKISKSSGGKYSATALRSKATATTAAYMNLIGKRVQKGLKDLGIADTPGTLESDDEEEAMDAEEEESSDASKAKCGALAFADAFIDEREEDGGGEIFAVDDNDICKVELGLRHCFFDTRATEALAAVFLEARNKMGMHINMDLRMNNVLEEETVSALSGDMDYESDLSEMAERYLEAMEALRISRQRSLEAAKAAAARMRAEAEMEAAWGAPVDMGDDDYGTGDGYDEEDRWDLNTDYDYGQEESDEYF